MYNEEELKFLFLSVIFLEDFSQLPFLLEMQKVYNSGIRFQKYIKGTQTISKSLKLSIQILHRGYIKNQTILVI